MTREDTTACRHFGAVIAMLSQPALLLDRRGNIVLSNAALAGQIPPNDAPFVGRNVVDIMGDTDKGLFIQFMRRCAAGDVAVDKQFDCTLNIGAHTLEVLVSGLWVDDVFHGLMCQAHAPLHQEDLKLKFLMDHLEQGIWDYDTRSRVFVVSEAWLRMRGLTRGDEINDLGLDWLDDIHPDDRAALKNVFEGQTLGASPNVNIQYRRKHAKGHWFWVLCCSKVMAVDKNGIPTRIVGSDTDITELRQSETDMAQLAEKLRLAIDASEIGIWEFDPNTGTVFWDDTMLEMYGLTDGDNERSGELWETYLHPDDLADTLAYSDHCQKNGLDFRRDYRVIHSNGDVRHIRSRASQVEVPGRLPKLIGANIDVTEDYVRTKELVHAKAQLLHDSRHDALTGLANRRLLDETANAYFENVGPDQSYGALQLDLDHFKKVNDTLGHAAGDAVLISVAQTLRSIIAQDGLVCRMGGDEFSVFFETAPNRAALEHICSAIIDAVREPIRFDQTTCKIGVSIGGAVGRGTPAKNGSIFSRADAALYAAKSAGRNCYRVSSSKDAAA